MNRRIFLFSMITVIFFSLSLNIFGEEISPHKKPAYKVKFYRGDYRDREEKANEDGAICYVEQHFNSTGGDPNTNYTMVLITTGASDFTRTWAEYYMNRVSEQFQLNKWKKDGIKVLVQGDRGYGNLKYLKMPAILPEPFLICNSTGVEWAKTRQDELARILVDSIYKFFPEGGLVAFSVGHKYKISNINDKGACPFEGICEIDFNEAVLEKAAKILDPDYTVSSIEDSPKYFNLFNEICELVEKNFYDPGFIGTDFNNIKEIFRTNAGEIRTDREFSKVINNMLKQFKTSHTNYYTEDDPEYYQLASIFSSLPEIKKIFKDKDILYPATGLFTKEIDSKIFIVSVMAGSVSEKAGLMMGDEIVSVDGEPYRGVASFIDKPDGVTCLIKRKEKEEPFQVKLRAEIINPSEEFLRAEKETVQVVDKIGYIHIWNFAGESYYDEFISAISDGILKDADSLIFDLRDGWGGANPDYLNVFNEKIPEIQIIDRDGTVRGGHSQWKKPVVMLVNERVRSGKEILAYGFKKYKIGTLIGENTAGAVLAGKVLPVSDGSLLYLPCCAALIDGENLEGKGVEPDIAVPFDIRYCEGKDLQLEKAIEYLKNL
ncbi:MAG: S41 family peptidase [Candidatus Eremiobacterota bacterium]